MVRRGLARPLDGRARSRWIGVHGERLSGCVACAVRGRQRPVSAAAGSGSCGCGAWASSSAGPGSSHAPWRRGPAPAFASGVQPCQGLRRQGGAQQGRAAGFALRGGRTVRAWLSPWRTRQTAAWQGRQAARAGHRRQRHGHAPSGKATPGACTPKGMRCAVHAQALRDPREKRNKGGKPGDMACFPSRKPVSQPAAKPLRRAVCHWLNWHCPRGTPETSIPQLCPAGPCGSTLRGRRPGCWSHCT